MLDKFRTLFMRKHAQDEKEKTEKSKETKGAKPTKGKPPFSEKHAKAISRLTDQTQMSSDEAEKCLKEAKARLGIEPNAYVRYWFCTIPVEEQAERWAEIKETEKQRKENDRLRRKRLHERLAEASGLSIEEAKKAAKKAREKYGISLNEYVSGKYYALSDEEMQSRHEEHLKSNEEKNSAMYERYINRLATILSIDNDAADKLLTDAKDKWGISPLLYIKYSVYDVPEEEQAAFIQKTMLMHEESRIRMFAIRERNISRVTMWTGWSHNMAEQKMEEAYRKYGITFSQYLNHKFFLLSDEEQKALKEELDNQELNTAQENKLACIEDIMNYSGCSREEAERSLDTTIVKTGMPYNSYRRYRFYEIPEDQHVERYKEIIEQLKSRTDVQIEDNDKYLEKIMETSGWDQEETLEKLLLADEYCGASWKDFYAYEFWDIEEKLQSTYFTSGMQKALSSRFDELSNRNIFVNKENFLEEFADTTGRLWGVSNRMSFDEFKDLFKDCDKVLYKPSNNGNGGNGIEVFTMEDPAKAYEKIQALPRGIIEEYLIQHHKMSEIYPHSVNTIRVATVSWKDEETDEEHFEIAYASLRIGSGGSNVDNFTTGGMVANIDLSTGKVLTDGVNVEGETFPLHPDTGTPIKGFDIPYFKEGLDLVRSSGAGIHGYIGWDVAITEHGPVLIEANVDPGNRLLQIPWMPERKGVAYVMEKYLRMTDFFDKHPEAVILTGDN